MVPGMKSQTQSKGEADKGPRPPKDSLLEHLPPLTTSSSSIPSMKMTPRFIPEAHSQRASTGHFWCFYE